MKKNRLLRNEKESPLSQYTLVPIFRDPLKKKRLLKSVRKRVRARVKRKSAVTFVTALFFLVAGTRISSISFRMDVKGGLNNEKLRPLRDLPFYIPIRF
jgi:hypothetical protein